MSLKGRRRPVRVTILSFFGVFVLATILLSSALISYVAYQIEETIWTERRQDAAGNAEKTILAFLDRVEHLLVFSVGDLGCGHDLNEIELLLNSDPAFSEIIQVDPDGVIINSVAHGEKVLANAFAVRQSYWFAEVQKNSPYLGPVEYAADGSAYVIVAVQAPSGQILAARVSMPVLSQIVQEIALGSGGRVYVVDATGYILAHPDPALTAGYTSISANPALAQALEFNGGTWQGRYRNLAGMEVFGTARRIGDTGWTVFAEVSVLEAYENSRKTWMLQFAAIILLGSTAMFTTARLLDRWIFTPIQKLRSGAEDIQLGDLAVRVPDLRVDEIGDVAHAFNGMAASLQVREQALVAQTGLLQAEVETRLAAQQELEALNRDLEERVDERTRELSETNLRLQESERQFHSLVENIPAVTYQADLTDDGPRVFYVSPQIDDLTGFTPNEWVAPDRWAHQIHPEDYPTLEKFHNQMRATADRYTLEYRLFTREGAVVWVRDQGIVADRSGYPRYIQGVMSDITRERERQDLLTQQALHDPLTGLPNRNLFIERLTHMMARAQRHPEITYAVLFLDMDGFKLVNDTLGHTSGDLVLIEAAARIRMCVRAFDTVARFGGDEFVVLVEDPKDHEALQNLVERIQTEIEKPFRAGEVEFLLGVSVGMACCDHQYLSPEEMIKAADLRMYRAKMERKAARRSGQTA